LDSRGITWAYLNEYSSNVADAREKTLAGSKLNSYDNNLPLYGYANYDKIFWIDSDISWETKDFIRLYESDKDIISGAYHSNYGFIVAHKKLLHPPINLKDLSEDEKIIEVEGVGFGFLAVKNGVFEKLSKPWFQQAYAKKIQEDGSLKSYVLMGEDLSFCSRVLEHGFKIYLDTDVRLNHHKKMKISWEGVSPE